MKLCAWMLLLSSPALGARTALVQIGARVVRSATISARVVAGRAHVEHRGAALHRTAIERAPGGGLIVTVQY